MQLLELSSISEPVRCAMEEFNRLYEQALSTCAEPMRSVMHRLSQSKGKQIRPMLVLLSAKLTGDITPSSYRAAVFVEMMHGASLLHDDVIDESDQRHGHSSLNHLWGNRTAIIAGDYLLTRAISLLTAYHDEFILSHAIETASDMCEGELMQSAKSSALDINEQEYFDIIMRKTASLMGTCCALGALSVKASSDDVARIKEYGKNLGIVFQMRDDVLDYMASSEIGKPVRNDIRERKLTLPLIYFLERMPEDKRTDVLNDIRIGRNLDEIAEMVVQSDGIAYAQRRIEDYGVLALKQLDVFPPYDALKSLQDLVAFSSYRNL